jgi:hypothetical protein
MTTPDPAEEAAKVLAAEFGSPERKRDIEAEKLRMDLQARFGHVTIVCAVFVMGIAIYWQRDRPADSFVAFWLALIPLIGGAVHIALANRVARRRIKKLLAPDTSNKKPA